jgi:O-antigen/teichoic acid export membrane protein
MSLSQMGSTYVVSQRFRGASADERCRLITTMTALILASSSFFAVVFVTGFILLQGAWGLTDGLTLTMIVLVAVESIGSSVHLLNRQTSRLGSAPGYYSVVTVLKSVTGACVTLGALFLFDVKGMALFIGHAAGGVVVLLGSLAALSRFFKARIDWELVREAVRLGGWTTASSLAQQARQTVERAALSRFTGLHDLGLYVHAQQYQTLVLLGCQPAQSAVIPVLLDEAKEREPRFARTARSSNVLFLGVTVFGVAAALFGREVIGLLTHDKFNAATPYAAMLVAIVLIQISGRPQLAYLLAHGRGRYISLCNIFAAAASMLTLVALVGHFGLVAAISASAVQFLIYRVASGLDPYATVRLPFQDGGAVAGFVAIVGAVAISEFFDPGWLVRALLFVGFLAVVFVVGRSTVMDILLQVQSHFGYQRRTRSVAKVESWTRVRSDPLR